MPGFVPAEEVFKGRHFDLEIVVRCIRWYLSYKLSYRDLVAMMSERGIAMAHTTILRWVQHCSPEFEKQWGRYARPVGVSWRCDETYIKVKGRWVYLYRAVDKTGKTVDFYLSRNRDVNAAKAFLPKALKSQRVPNQDHAGCLRRVTPSGGGIASAGRVTEAGTSAEQQVVVRKNKSLPLSGLLDQAILMMQATHLRTHWSSSFEKMLSLSWITNRYGWSPGRASRNCCSVHSAVG